MASSLSTVYDSTIADTNVALIRNGEKGFSEVMAEDGLTVITTF